MAFEVFSYLLLLLGSLGILVKSADFLISITEKLAKKFKINPFIAGVTLLAFGTSIPELVTSIISVFSGMETVVVGNALGANIANLLLIMGVLAIMSNGLKSKWNMVKTDLPLLFCSVILLGIVVWDYQITLYEAIFLLFGAGTYVYYLINEHRKGMFSFGKKFKSKKVELSALDILLMIASVFGIYVGAKLTLVSIDNLTLLFNLVDYSIISSTLLAIGTTLPELVVSYKAVRKKRFEMAIGNIIGSNVFNTYLVIGIPTFLAGSLAVSPLMVTIGLPFLVLSSVSFLIIALDNEIHLSEGMMLLLFYAMYVFKIYMGSL
jgi:cation:H+ antiporter